MRHYITPGRVELVGKHVDYGGGPSLTCAIDVTMRATAWPIAPRVLRVHMDDTGEADEIAIDPAAHPTSRHWSVYVAAVARRMARDFPRASGGVELRIASTIPPAAGLSSSTALTITLARALADATNLPSDPLFAEIAGTPLAFAEYVAAVEGGAPYGPFAGDEGVGTRGGAQDHVAIMCARERMVGQFAYLPAREHGWAPWPEDRALVIAVSGVRASKTDNALRDYNRAADSLGWLVSMWNALTGRDDRTLAAALASHPTAGELISTIALTARDAPADSESLFARLTQFREETEVIVPGVADALRARDLARVGALVDRSQALAEQALGNQVPETIHLARSARELGADAASAFGAGFGGAVWAMVARDGAEEFIARWRDSYAEAFAARARDAQFLITRPSGAASAVAM